MFFYLNGKIYSDNGHYFCDGDECEVNRLNKLYSSAKLRCFNLCGLPIEKAAEISGLSVRSFKSLHTKNPALFDLVCVGIRNCRCFSPSQIGELMTYDYLGLSKPEK